MISDKQVEKKKKKSFFRWNYFTYRTTINRTEEEEIANVAVVGTLVEIKSSVNVQEIKISGDKEPLETKKNNNKGTTPSVKHGWFWNLRHLVPGIKE